jgi:hypothetical protein
MKTSSPKIMLWCRKANVSGQAGCKLGRSYTTYTLLTSPHRRPGKGGLPPVDNAAELPSGGGTNTQLATRHDQCNGASTEPGRSPRPPLQATRELLDSATCADKTPTVKLFETSSGPTNATATTWEANGDLWGGG